MLRLGRSNFSNSCNRQRDFAGRTPRRNQCISARWPYIPPEGTLPFERALLDPLASHNRRPTGS